LSLRNRHQSAVALLEREAIRAVLATRRQDEPLYTSKEILRILGWPAHRLRSIRRSVHSIRRAALREAARAPQSASESDHDHGEGLSPL
jgi:hypothetical protein